MVAVTVVTSANLPQLAFPKGDSVKVLSRVASPAGFALVLLLFAVLPFMSVSCEVPGAGSIGVTYSGTNLATGSEPEPEVSQELTDAFEGLGGAAPGETSEEAAPDPGVQVLAILAALVILFGVGTVLIPRIRTRLFGGAAAAGVALVLTVVTLLVAQSNLESELTSEAQDTGVAEGVEGMPDVETVIKDMIGSEIGFWLVVIGLGLLVAGNLGAVFLGGRTPKLSFAGAPAGEPPTQPAAGPTEVDPLTGQVLAPQPETPAETPPAPPADPPAEPPKS